MKPGNHTASPCRPGLLGGGLHARASVICEVPGVGQPRSCLKHREKGCLLASPKRQWPQKMQKKYGEGTSLVVGWLRLRAPSEGPRLDP